MEIMLIKTIKCVLSIPLMLLVLSGCESTSRNLPSETYPVPQERLTAGTVQRSIHKGMRSADVISVLGAPNVVTHDKEGNETWVYERIHSDYKVSNNSGGLNLILVGFGSGSSSASRSEQTLTIIIHFDESSSVSDFSFKSTTF